MIMKPCLSKVGCVLGSIILLEPPILIRIEMKSSLDEVVL